MRVNLRSDRLIIAAIGLVLLAAGAVYYVLRHARELNLDIEADRILLGVLTIIMALLVVALLFLLLRNLIKLLVERRHQVLGSRFRTKLVFIFLILVLIPSLALFWAAVNLILDVNEGLFVDPLEQITGDAKKVVEAYNHLVRDDCARLAESFAEQVTEYRLLEPARARALETRAIAFAETKELDFLEVYETGTGRPIYSWKRPAGPTFAPPPDDVEAGRRMRHPTGGKSVVPANLLRQTALDAMRGRETTNRLDRLDREGSWQRASAATPVRSGSPFGEASGAVVVGRYIPPDLAERTAAIAREFRDYRNSTARPPQHQEDLCPPVRDPDPARAFAATWTGFYLSRQITVPIQALAEGTREISAGNLDYRVTARCGGRDRLPDRLLQPDDGGAARKPRGDRGEPPRSSRSPTESSRSAAATSSSSSRTCPRR